MPVVVGVNYTRAIKITRVIRVTYQGGVSSDY